MTESDKEPSKKLTRKQVAMVKALVETLGNVTTACLQVGISRETHYRWTKENALYKERTSEVEEIELDFYENALRKQIKEGNAACIIFALKTRGRKRGYIEKNEVEHTGARPIQLVFEDIDGQDKGNKDGQAEASVAIPERQTHH
jgi:undecaprenyl pyrophosphate synthase